MSRKEYSKFGSIVVEIPLHLLYNDKVINSITTSGAIVKKKGESGIVIRANPDDELKITNEGEMISPIIKLDKNGLPKKLKQVQPTTRHGFIEVLEDMKKMNNVYLKKQPFNETYKQFNIEFKELLTKLKELSDNDFSKKDKLKEIKDEYKKLKKEFEAYFKQAEKNKSKIVKRRELTEKIKAYQAIQGTD